MAQDPKTNSDKKSAEERQIDKMSPGGQVGGTHFGQAPGDAKHGQPSKKD
ncbi:hypothetical protein IC608_15435 [Devosia sp. PTR5]|uniref:Uncharacterized protein n=1 Tax=Devosia oryzisoli TaxID=2774138 RepID=A0A927FVS7_9HYPH|nr:hypothetical protein [Devosia oryzisoli]MBD8066866.1 hypothetical protein [Devosia oryzisoli]